jgi:hypothetical protein
MGEAFLNFPTLFSAASVQILEDYLCLGLSLLTFSKDIPLPHKGGGDVNRDRGEG